MIAGLIPTDVLPITGQKTDSNPRRVTLIHKLKENRVFILSRGMNEIQYGVPVEDALVIRAPEKDRVSLLYESKLTFEKRRVSGDRGYLLVKNQNELSEKTILTKMPYYAPTDFPSDILSPDESTNGLVNELLSASNDYIVSFFESVADRGLVRAASCPKYKEASNRKKSAGKQLYVQLNGIFSEEHENLPVRKHDIKPMDQRLRDYFIPGKASLVKRIGAFTLISGILSMTPISLPDLIEEKLKKDYDKRFQRIKDEHEQAAIALSEFAFCHPKLISGLRRSYYESKAFSNLGIYALQAGFVTYAGCNWSPWLSVPMMIPTLISGAAILRNAVRSRGLDFSGVIGSLIENSVLRELHGKK